ncbi:uncharacterized protein FYW61_001286 isoform 3-T5 [Anableps anableps]
MSDLEAQVCAILDVMVTATVSEMDKVIRNSDPAPPNELPSRTENKQESSDQKVMQFSVLLASLAQEAVEKICQLFEECSSVLRLEVLQGATEMEDLRRRLREVEMDLKLVMEGSAELGGQEEVTEEQSEETREEEECCPRSPCGVSGETGVRRSPIIHLWKNRTYEDSIQSALMKQDILEASIKSGQNRDDPAQEDDDDPDYMVEAVDPDNGNDPVYTIRPRGLMKPRSRVRAPKESRGQREQPLSCRFCRKTFSKLLQLKAHQAVHGASTEKPFICSQCGRGFSFQRSLSAHMLIHTGERPHTCDVCGKGFTLKQLLRNHQRLHADVRPFCCDQCGKSFYRAHGLKLHRRVHTGERLYNCHYCDKSFTIPEKRLEDAPEDLPPGREETHLRRLRHRGTLHRVPTETHPDARQRHPVHVRALQPPPLLHHRAARAPAAAYAGAASLLRRLREELQVVQLPEDPPEGAQRRAAVRLRDLRPSLHTAEQPEITSGGPHRRETVQLRYMRKVFRQHGQPEEAPAHPHGREAVQLRRLRPPLQPGQQPEGSSADPHRGETVHVRQVWQKLLLPEEPQGPQVFLRLKRGHCPAGR